jgi:hypothetical protein
MTEPITSAADLKAECGADFPLTLPRTKKTIAVWKPDLQAAIVEGIIPLPLLKSVLMDAALAAMLGLDRDDDPEPDMAAKLVERLSPATGEYINRWVCLAVRAPRVVLDDKDESPTSIWVGRLPLADRAHIFNATFTLGDLLRAGGPAGAAFREQPDGADGGASGSAIPLPPLGAGGDSGSGDGV